MQWGGGSLKQKPRPALGGPTGLDWPGQAPDYGPHGPVKTRSGQSDSVEQPRAQRRAAQRRLQGVQAGAGPARAERWAAAARDYIRRNTHASCFSRETNILVDIFLMSTHLLSQNPSSVSVTAESNCKFILLQIRDNKVMMVISSNARQ